MLQAIAKFQLLEMDAGANVLNFPNIHTHHIRTYHLLNLRPYSVLLPTASFRCIFIKESHGQTLDAQYLFPLANFIDKNIAELAMKLL